MDLMHSLFIFMTALLAALIMVPALRRWALDTGNVDVPDARKVHKGSIPRIGGVAIFMAFLFSLLVYAEMTSQMRGILAGALVIFFTGLIDDLHGLSPKAKFLGEIFACIITISVGGFYLSRLGDLFGTGPIVLPQVLAIPFTIFAVVGVINAMNLIDGLDGLAGGVSVIALSAFFVLAFRDGNTGAASVCVALLGGILGFLKYNFYPARIFMGDTGSLVVGFLIGFLAVYLTQQPGSGISPILPVLIIGLPIIDTIWVMTRRVLRGGSPFAPDMTHVHHKFLDLGLQHRFTVLVIYGISLFWAIVAVVFHRLPESVLLFGYLVLSVAFYMTLRYMLNNRERFAIFAKDSAISLRESETYGRISSLAHRLVPVLVPLFVLYLVLAALFGGPAGGKLWQLVCLLLILGASLLYFTRDTRNSFFLATLYLGGLVIIFSLEGDGRQPVALGISLNDFANYLFIFIAALAAFKIFFKKAGDFFLTTLDFLVFGISIFLAAVFFDSDGFYLLSTTLLKGVIFFLAIKVVSGYNKAQAGVMVYATMAVLLVIGVRSFLV